MNATHRSAIRTLILAAAGGLLLAASAASASQTSALPGQGPSTHRPAPATPLPLPTPHLSVKRLRPPPPVRPVLSIAPAPVEPRDFYCSDTKEKFAKCDIAFEKKCDKANGTLSELQDWGGKTCVEPTG